MTAPATESFSTNLPLASVSAPTKAEPLAPADCEAVRSLQAEALVRLVCDGKPFREIEAELVSLRKELVGMGGYTAGQVGGASAFFRYWGSEAIADFNRMHPDRPIVVSDKLAVAAAYQLLQVQGAGDSSDFRLEHFAERLGVSTDDLQELASLYGERVNGYRAKHGLDAELERARPPPATTEQVPDDQGEPVQEALTGRAIREWEVDYDTDQKEAWRETWASFIEKHFTREQLATATVLCLPSVRAELEVRHYLRLGVRPENIYAIDHATGAGGATFRDACARLGINCFQGSLEKFLENDYPPISIANLDFHGQLSARSLRILSSLRLAREAVVLTNFMGCREPNHTQDVLSDMVLKGSAWFNDELAGAPATVEPGLRLDEVPIVQELERRKKAIAEQSIYDRRQAGLAMAVWRHIGRDYWMPDWPPAAAALAGLTGEKRHEIGMRLTTYAKWLGEILETVGVEPVFFMRDLVLSLTVAAPVVNSAERWRYISSSGKGGRPYESTYLRIGFPERTGGGAWKCRDLAWAFINAVGWFEVKNLSLPEVTASVVSGDAYRTPKSHARKVSDVIRVTVDGKEVGSLQYRDYIRDCDRWAASLDKRALNFKEMHNLPVQPVPVRPAFGTQPP